MKVLRIVVSGVRGPLLALAVLLFVWLQGYPPRGGVHTLLDQPGTAPMVPEITFPPMRLGMECVGGCIIVESWRPTNKWSSWELAPDGRSNEMLFAIEVHPGLWDSSAPVMHRWGFAVLRNVISQGNVYTGYVIPCWALAAFLVGVGIIRARRFLRHSAVQGARCANCGYDLRASPQRCPECGHPRQTHEPAQNSPTAGYRSRSSALAPGRWLYSIGLLLLSLLCVAAWSVSYVPFEGTYEASKNASDRFAAPEIVLPVPGVAIECIDGRIFVALWRRTPYERLGYPAADGRSEQMVFAATEVANLSRPGAELWNRLGFGVVWSAVVRNKAYTGVAVPCWVVCLVCLVLSFQAIVAPLLRAGVTTPGRSGTARDLANDPPRSVTVGEKNAM